MVTKHTSTAVMARRGEPAHSLDYFPTPPWATRALCEHVLPVAWPWGGVFAGGCLDPACGEGHMAVALGEYFERVEASDVFPYGFGAVRDFLAPDTLDLQRAPPAERIGWVVTNPPFNKAEAFIARALAIATRGVAMLLRVQFLEAEGRWKRLFSVRPPQVVAQFVERVPMHRGRWDPSGSTATAYCWLVWLTGPLAPRLGTQLIWIPPSRAALTRRDDALRFNAAAAVPLLEGC